MTEENAVEVLLEGGPHDLPETHRRRRANGTADTIKVPHLGGYEHFERTGEVTAAPGTPCRVYRWTARTLIAE